MTVHSVARRASRPRALLLVGAFSLALVAAACAPAVDTPTTGAVVTVSKSTGLDPAGETITVTGTGFTTTGNLGSRPPLLNQPAGVYVVFGTFSPLWRPSAGAESSTRTVITQFWALPPASYPVLASDPAAVQMNADGSFSVDIFVSPQTVPANKTLGIATYAGSGAINSGEEFLIPLEFDAPV